MGIARPQFTLSRGTRRRQSQAGGGGGSSSNEWKDWTDLPLNPTDANGWVVVDGSGVNSDTSLGMDGEILVFNQASTTKLQIHGSTMKGKAMIRKLHITPWAEAGIAVPSGTAANLFQPESYILKVEVQFDTAGGGPINGVASNYGQKMTCMVGLISYASDQSGSPTAGGTSVSWIAAQVKKAAGNEPSSTSNTNLYYSGYKTYHSHAGTNHGYSWKNQSSAPAQAHDSIVFCTPPIRKENNAGRNDIWGGSYSADTPFYPLSINGQSCYDNATKLSDSSGYQFHHICVWFGADDNSNVQGNIRIKKIRYVLQPVQNRASLT
jgi:hypothetical protein